MRITIFLITMLFITSCGSNNLIPQTISATDLNETNGVLIGSFLTKKTKPNYSTQTFYFRNEQTGEKHELNTWVEFNLFAGMPPNDINTSEVKGGVFALSLPAGDYTFYDFRLYFGNGHVENNWRSAEPYAIPFKVSPNEVNYVGEIKLSPNTRKNVFGISILDGGIWTISDQLSRDVPVLAKKFPEISFTDVVSVIPNEKTIDTPLVILPSKRGKYNQAKQAGTH